jgi:hypothetical protein
MTAAPSTPTPMPTPDKRRPGRFARLPIVLWDALWTAPATNRMQVVIVGLILLMGIDSGTGTSTWSTRPICRYTGLSKPNARRAIAELIAAGIYALAPDWTPEHPRYVLKVAASDGEAIYLACALVTGLGAGDKREASIFHRIRETHDPLLLKLLIDLCGMVELDVQFGVPLATVRSFNNRERAELAWSVGTYRVWSVPAPTVIEANGLDWGRYLAKGDNDADFWRRLRRLKTVGAVHWEPWLMTSAEADADPIYPMDDVGIAAKEAAERLINGADDERRGMTGNFGGTLVVLPEHCPPPAIQSFLKMRVEPDTTGARGAFADRKQIVCVWLERYGELLKNADFSKPLKTHIIL